MKSKLLVNKVEVEKSRLKYFETVGDVNRTKKKTFEIKSKFL